MEYNSIPIDILKIIKKYFYNVNNEIKFYSIIRNDFLYFLPFYEIIFGEICYNDKNDTIYYLKTKNVLSDNKWTFINPKKYNSYKNKIINKL